MSTITHHIPATTGQAHHMTLRLHLSYGVPAPVADYEIYGNILQDGETIPIAVTFSDIADIQLTIPPLIPGEHPYTLHIKHKSSGKDHVILQGNCNVSERIDGNPSDTENREQITATLSDDFSAMTVTVHIGPRHDVPLKLDLESILNDTEFLQRLKEACGIPVLEEALTSKAEKTDVETALASKADTAAMKIALSAKADTVALNTKADTSALIAGLATKADTSSLNNYIPYANLGRALTKASDGKVDVDLSNYTGTTVNIIGTTSTCIGRNSTQRLEITADIARIRHLIKSELLCGSCFIYAAPNEFIMNTNSSSSTSSSIYAWADGIRIKSRDEINLSCYTGNQPGLVVHGAGSCVLIRKNSTTTYDNLAVFGNSSTTFWNSTTFTNYATFQNGHN